MQKLTTFIKHRKEILATCFLALLSAVFQLSTFHFFEFHRDELLYLSFSGNPGFGYHSVPPFIGFLAFISIRLFGYSLFAARFFPAIAGGLLIILVTRIVKEFKGNFHAQLLAAVSVLVSILFVRASGLFQPVVFDILFWTLSFWLIIKYVNTSRFSYLVLLGITLGFGFLNKYNMVFLILAVFIVIPFTPFRKIFRSKYLYIAGLVALAIVMPNIFWQVKNNFPVITHMEQLRSSQLANMNATTFLTEQLLMVFPSTLIAIPGFLMLFFLKHLKEFRFLGYISLVILLIFIFLQGKSYYTAGIYPLLIAAGATGLMHIFRKTYLFYLFLLILLTFGWFMLPMGKPIYQPEKLVAYFDKMQDITGNDAIRRYEDNRYHKLPQDYADMLGWEELAGLANMGIQKLTKEHPAYIYCENYGQAGAIHIIGKKYGLPEAISFSDHFRYWLPESFDTEITEFIYINDEVGEDVQDLFSDIEEIGRVSNPLAREYGTGVFVCKYPKRSFNKFYEEIVRNL
jgi:hypothetical protein